MGSLAVTEALLDPGAELRRQRKDHPSHDFQLIRLPITAVDHDATHREPRQCGGRDLVGVVEIEAVRFNSDKFRLSARDRSQFQFDIRSHRSAG